MRLPGKTRAVTNIDFMAMKTKWIWIESYWIDDDKATRIIIYFLLKILRIRIQGAD